MLQFRVFLLMLFFALQTTLAGAAPIRTCCDEACPPTMCAAMGCLPTIQPLMTSIALPLQLPSVTVHFAEPAAIDVPLPVKEVWTPPD